MVSLVAEFKRMVDNDVDRRVKKTQMKAFSPELNIENGEDSIS
jgi:hypothetical protein